MVKKPKKSATPVADRDKMIETVQALVKERTGWETIPEKSNAAIGALTVTLSNPRFENSADDNNPYSRMKMSKVGELSMSLVADGMELRDARILALDASEACLALIPASGKKSTRAR